MESRVGDAAVAALAGLRAAIDAVHEVALSCLDLDEVEALTVGVLGESERLTAAASTAVAECDRRGLARRRGSFGSTTAHLATFTRGPTAAIAPARTSGRWLTDYPLLAAAWAGGDITHAHLTELRRADNPRIHQLLIRDQHLHIDAARTLQFTDWLRHLAYWLLHADPDGSLTPHRQHRYGITLRTRPNGDITLTGTLDPLTGEALLTMLERETTTLRHTEHDNFAPTHQSSTRQLHAIALLRLTKRGFQRPDGGWPAPLINIVMSEPVAEDLISRMTNGDTHNPHQLPLHYTDIDKRCETIRGTPLDPRTTWPALITGRLRRQIINAKNQTINLGRDTRLFTPTQKQALLVTARGQCSTTACDSPFAWLEADHTTPWTKGGQTNLEDGDIKCKPCNLNKSDN